ncbi:hypothetical protein A1D19_05755 [Lonepinella koalarum]|nr:hypothetical protein [Lonepinella koalarum]
MSLEQTILQSIERVQSEQHNRMLTFDEMVLLATNVEKTAQEMGIDVVFSLVDKNGLQRFYFAMPNTLLVSHQLAFQKAYTAIAMKMPTHQLNAMLQPHADLYLLSQNNPNITGIGGGFLCKRNGSIVAGLGVSGGSVEQDMAILRKAVEKFCLGNYFITID